jgi:dTDP-glucose 4,6-dehydratase
VSDLVEGLHRLLVSKYNKPVNLGNPVEMTIRQLAEAILAKTGAASTIELRPLPEDDPKVRQPDISLARKLLGWSPEVSLDRGLTETIAYFRTKLASL